MRERSQKDSGGKNCCHLTLASNVPCFSAVTSGAEKRCFRLQTDAPETEFVFFTWGLLTGF